MQASGYPVWGVGSAEAFYKRYLFDPVELLILDIGLPGEDGISVAQHLRELPQLTVIIVSARNAVDDRLAGLRAGADRYLVKPVDFAELVANIETIDRRSPVAVCNQEEMLSAQKRLDVMLTRLRKKALLTFGQDLPIKTVPQVGYVFTALLMESQREIERP